MDGLTLQDIQKVFDEAVRPMLMAHGGNARLVAYHQGVLTVQMVGQCAGCPGAETSTRLAIEETLQQVLPDITRVEVESTPVSQELLDFARQMLSKAHRTEE